MRARPPPRLSIAAGSSPRVTNRRITVRIARDPGSDMTDEPSIEPAPPRARRWPIVATLLVAVAAAGWTAVWATARGRIVDEIDARLARLAEHGITIVCDDRSVAGYPFRMELACRSPGATLAARGLSGSAAGLRVVAQVWDPRLILLELDGPGILRTADGETTATWRRLRASLRWRTDGVERLSIAAESLDLTSGPRGRPALRLTAEHAEAHGRPTGADLDLAASLAAAALTLADKRLGPPKADLSLDLRLAGFLPPGPGPALPAFAERGGVVEPIRLTLAVGGVAIEGAGKLVLDPAGLLDGMITLTARGLDSLATGGAKDLGPELTAALSGFALMGKAATDPARPGRRLEMIVDHGLVRLARLTLGRIPPLFASGG